jgi:hypothetical protein
MQCEAKSFKEKFSNNIKGLQPECKPRSTLICIRVAQEFLCKIKWLAHMQIDSLVRIGLVAICSANKTRTQEQFASQICDLICAATWHETC